MFLLLLCFGWLGGDACPFVQFLFGAFVGGVELLAPRSSLGNAEFGFLKADLGTTADVAGCGTPAASLASDAKPYARP